MFPDCKLYCKAMVIKITLYSHKNSNVNWWNATENTEINPCLYDQLIYDKGNKNTQCGKGSLVNNVGKTGQLHAKESNWTTFSHHIQKQTQMDWRLKYKTWNHKTTRRKHRQYTLWYSSYLLIYIYIFFCFVFSDKENKGKNNQMWLC